MAVAPGTPLDVSVDLTSVEDGVLVQVATSVDLVGECVRCLDEVRDHHDVSSAEVYFEPGAPALTSSDEEDEEADDLFVIGERDTINIETQLRDAIVTLVDPRPLCSPTARACAMCAARSGQTCPPITTTSSSIRAWPPWRPCWGRTAESGRS